MDWTSVGGIVGSLGVAFGAFGAHGLKNKVREPKLLDDWKTASSYQMVHAMMIVVSGLARKSNNLSPKLFTVGTLMFSGSIYGLVLLPPGHGLRKVLGPVTPLGGLMLIAGWANLVRK
eukprot:TRINITY_DN60572_c0_g1_i1.p1 TRINITY_DN60572_c0_g1~~TRINITY_DN60572_c0_g1_i1.p1  ORF type:complete len:118 (-),score=19.83 TRINITY_DN60572_c0_g1_i1:27-380(-)